MEEYKRYATVGTNISIGYQQIVPSFTARITNDISKFHMFLNPPFCVCKIHPNRAGKSKSPWETVAMETVGRRSQTDKRQERKRFWKDVPRKKDSSLTDSKRLTVRETKGRKRRMKWMKMERDGPEDTDTLMEMEYFHLGNTWSVWKQTRCLQIALDFGKNALKSELIDVFLY